MAAVGWRQWTIMWVATLAILTALVQVRFLADLDHRLLEALASARPAQLSEPMNWIFRLGFAQLDVALAVAWSAILIWRYRARSSKWRDARIMYALAPLLIFVVIFVQAGMRLVVDQPEPRPDFELHRTFAPQPQPLAAVLDKTDAAARESFAQASEAAVRQFVPQPAVSTQPPERGSYPSGHSSRALFLSLLVVNYLALARGSEWSTGYRIISVLLVAAALVLAALISYSAMYFGYHWPTDILAGFLIAAIVFTLAKGLMDEAQTRVKGDANVIQLG